MIDRATIEAIMNLDELREREAAARAYVEAYRAFHAGDFPESPKLGDELESALARLLAAYPELQTSAVDDRLPPIAEAQRGRPDAWWHG